MLENRDNKKIGLKHKYIPIVIHFIHQYKGKVRIRIHSISIKGRCMIYHKIKYQKIM